MSQWKVADVNDTNGEAEYNEIIPRNRDMMPRRQINKNAINFFIFY